MQVLSSLSGLPFSAVSAGYAPTNSADVSAIASAYVESGVSSKLDTTAQVVTSTGSGSYDGTACVSGINGLPINAHVAGMAYSDSDLRPISSLPDSAAVSSIASSYVDSAVSGKQDTLTFAYDADSAISSINGSALAGGSGAPVVVTGYVWDTAVSNTISISSNLSAAQSNSFTRSNGTKSNCLIGFADNSGYNYDVRADMLAPGAEQPYINSLMVYSPVSNIFSADGTTGGLLAPLRWATGAGFSLSAGYFRGSVRGDTVFLSRGPLSYNSSNSSQVTAVHLQASTGTNGCGLSAYGSNTTGYYGRTFLRVQMTGKSGDDTTAASSQLNVSSLTFGVSGSSVNMGMSSIPYWNDKIDGSALGWLEVND